LLQGAALAAGAGCLHSPGSRQPSPGGWPGRRHNFQAATALLPDGAVAAQLSGLGSATTLVAECHLPAMGASVHQSLAAQLRAQLALMYTGVHGWQVALCKEECGWCRPRCSQRWRRQGAGGPGPRPTFGISVTTTVSCTSFRLGADTPVYTSCVSGGGATALGATCRPATGGRGAHRGQACRASGAGRRTQAEHHPAGCQRHDGRRAPAVSHSRQLLLLTLLLRAMLLVLPPPPPPLPAPGAAAYLLGVAVAVKQHHKVARLRHRLHCCRVELLVRAVLR